MNASQREREVRPTNHVIEQPPSSLERGALTPLYKMVKGEGTLAQQE